MDDKERIFEALRTVLLGDCPIEGRQGEYVTSDGVVVRYFQSNCSDEAIVERMIAFQEPETDPYQRDQEFEIEMRRLAKIDGRHVHKELGGKKLVHLGLRVNKVPDRFQLRRRR